MPATTTDPVTDPLTRKLNREVVRYAVMRAIFCPACGDVLDMRRAVLLTVTAEAGSAARVSCGTCHDGPLAEAVAGLVANPDLTVEVLDGRHLWKRGR